MNDVGKTPVGQFIASAFAQASQKYADLHRSWTQASFRVAGLLPFSLMTCVQRDGWIDIVLRCMEDEFDGRDDGVNMVDMHLHFQVLISEMWIGGVYETIRLLAHRKLAPDSDDFRTLAHDLRLLRIPLEKHEIAGDRQLTEPLKFVAHPPDKNSAKVYEYDKADPRRVHVMPRGFSGRGSATWMVLDVTTGNPSERWIERRELSDRFLALWPPVT